MAGIGQYRSFVGANRNGRLRIRKQSLGRCSSFGRFRPTRTLMAQNADRNLCDSKGVLLGRESALFSKLVAEIERDHDDAVLLIVARQQGWIIDPRIAQINIFEGPADVHAFVPLVLSADGIADLSIHR